MPKLSAAEVEHRLAEATTALRQSLASLLLSLREDHPVPGCLPIPALRVPADITDMADHAQEIYTNLWSLPHGRCKAEAWIAAWDTCPHLPDGGVHAVWEVLDAWRSLLLCAAGHAQGRKQAFGLDDCQNSVLARLTDLDRLIAHSDRQPPS
ncbi:hypothetical protein AB0B66_10500 [Catellatospora sp. NPDC049111]|uniref:hypothetical protein n=1 Tax=Catellatospora sp. NPDC049111 TaxID=3155271 RepID=UPI0033C1F953